MTLEDQSHSVGRYISLLYRYGSMFAHDKLQETGIGKGQYIYLNALYKEDGITQERLSDFLKIDKGTTAKALKKLEAEGYIRRIQCQEDKRCLRVYLTERGMSVKPVVRGVLLEWRHILTTGFTEEEKQMTLSLLDRMAENAAAHGGSLSPEVTES